MATAAVLAWMRLARVYHKVDRASAAHLRRRGLSVAQLDVLARVGARPGMTQGELAEALLVTKGNVCQLLDRMEAEGLLQRRREGRSKRLHLTPRGAALAAEVVPAQERVVDGLFGVLDPAAQRELLGLLRRLDRRVR
ncbi:MAG TPA: MarR family transcriptional regulator [Chloroflexota bacterium]|nr:MarR family transcriptional regulator [Chloroflexota bacterium]